MIQALTHIHGVDLPARAALEGLAGVVAPTVSTVLKPNVAVENTFASALANAVGSAIGTLHEAEGVSLQALQGETDMRKVVDDVMNAEQTLQAAIAIRDKIVSSYLEISRMTI